MDQLRRRKRHGDREAPLESDEGMIALPTDGAGPEHAAASGQIGERIAAAMDQLTPAERTAFTLRHLEGRSIQEIEQALGIRTNAAKNTVFRAVQKLRMELEPLMSEMS
jgi:RNA polymerase sigma-70 factor (ECF subfamily)